VLPSPLVAVYGGSDTGRWGVVEQQGLNFKLRHYRAEPGLVSTRKRAPMAHVALWSRKRLLITIGIVLSLLRGPAAFGQTGPVGWNGTWVGGWDRGAGVQLVFAGDQLVAFNWRGDYKDVRHSGGGKGSKRFAWDKGEATLTRMTEDGAQLVIREQGKPELSITLRRE
jgi:hypothetical protein